MDDVTWYALGLMLTVIGLFLSYRAYQRKGVAAGMRGAGWSLLPLAAALTDTLKLGGELTEDIGRWATHLVFSPLVWLGIALAGVSVVLLGVSGFLSGRGEPKQDDTKSLPDKPTKKTASPIDNEFDDIEAILRKHGIQ